MKFNLANATGEDVRNFAVAVIGKAVHDHYQNVTKHPSGKELVNEFASSSRVFHRRFATGLYNMTRQTMETSNLD